MYTQEKNVEWPRLRGLTAGSQGSPRLPVQRTSAATLRTQASTTASMVTFHSNVGIWEVSQIGNVDVCVNVDVESHPTTFSTLNISNLRNLAIAEQRHTAEGCISLKSQQMGAVENQTWLTLPHLHPMG